jgi:hypothetical protein
VCCDQLKERCDDKSLVPAACHTAGCARVVDLVEKSCAAAFADGFLGVAFKPQFDPLVQTCRAAETDPTPAYVISDPALQAVVTATCHGRVIDGATSSFLTSRTGVDAIVLQAPEGMQLRAAAEMMDLPPTANVRFYDGATDDDVELGMLRGTSLDDREFVSSKGLLRVMRAVDLNDDAGLPLVFSVRISCVCTDGAGGGCGAHSSCVNGLCKCDGGYNGGMCEIEIDHCKFPAEVNCGAHGSCIDGSCVCSDGYSGSACQIAPKQCCTATTTVNSRSCCCAFGCACDGACAKTGAKSCAGAFSWCDAHDLGWDNDCNRDC